MEVKIDVKNLRRRVISGALALLLTTGYMTPVAENLGLTKGFGIVAFAASSAPENATTLSAAKDNLYQAISNCPASIDDSYETAEDLKEAKAEADEIYSQLRDVTLGTSDVTLGTSDGTLTVESVNAVIKNLNAAIAAYEAEDAAVKAEAAKAAATAKIIAACDSFLVSKADLNTQFFAIVTLDATLTAKDAVEVYNAVLEKYPQYYFLNESIKCGGTEEAVTKITLMVKTEYMKYSERSKFIIPQNVKAEAEEYEVTLTWDKTVCTEKYDVQRLIDDEWVSVGTPTDATYVDTNVESGTEYSYRVLSFINDTWCDASEVISVKTKASTIPQNINATAGEGKVTITWDAVEGATKYRVQRTTGKSWSTVSYPSTTSYVDEAVTAATEYTYRILAYVDGAWGEASDVVKATPKAVVPKNVKATAGDGKVTITWDAAKGATKYRVQRYNGTAWATISTTTATSYADTTVTNGTEYSYRVLAYENGVWSAASDVVKATPKAAVIPQNVKAAAGDGKVTITWDVVTGATKYRVQRYNGTAWATISTTTATSYADTTVTNGTEYSYRVLAYVNGAWSGASSVVKATPKAVIIPQNVKASADSKKVTVTWSAVTGAAKYRVQRYNGTAWATVITTTATSYADTNVTNGTTYSYRVLAYVNGAWSGASAVVKATPSASVKNVTAAANNKQVTVKWSAVNGATKYRVQRLNGTVWGTVSTTTATSFTDKNLTNGTTYSYRVLAYVDGAWSSALTVVKATPTAVPQNVKATAGTKSATISWTAVSGATKYRVQRFNGTAWATVSYPTTASYTDTGLTTGKTYQYRVLAYVDGAWSAVSAAVSVTAK
ncbi:MAG: fibronectin type III domain-containing protein [Huintestinicola sp.]